jgi:hypothetical protein
MLALLVAAVPIALLPASAREVPQEAVQAAEAALRKSLPAPFEAAQLEVSAVEEHLLAAGPTCRADLICVCSAAELTRGLHALDLQLERFGTSRWWAADLRLVDPCDDEVIDRRSAVVEPSLPALSRWVSEAASALLRGRDLAPLRFAGAAHRS